MSPLSVWRQEFREVGPKWKQAGGSLLRLGCCSALCCLSVFIPSVLIRYSKLSLKHRRSAVAEAKNSKLSESEFIFALEHLCCMSLWASIFNKHTKNTILQPCGFDLGPALLFSISCLSLLSRLIPWCMRSSCCGWVEPRDKWTLTGYHCSPSPPKGACWPSQRAESHHPVMWEQSSSHSGGPQTKAGADNHQHYGNTQLYRHTENIQQWKNKLLSQGPGASSTQTAESLHRI